MQGMNAKTGEIISGMDHLEQSIRDILTTPLGSRVMRRDYGSRLFDLLDRPMGPELVADLQAAVVLAISMQETRIRLTRVTIGRMSKNQGNNNEVSEGKIVINLEGHYLPEGRQIALNNIIV